MPAYKDKSNKWYILTYAKDGNGDKVRKSKRGFTTKAEALNWEREFLVKDTDSIDMTLKSFIDTLSRQSKSFTINYYQRQNIFN